jgi:ubiquinone/menaquinone biosynthesis C-methylase UbiE
MLQRARQVLWEQSRSTLLARASAFRLPFPDRTFDAILCSGALHLFDRPQDALREISRTLQPGGDFICQTTIKPRHSAGLATFLDKIIRFGFFPSTAVVDALVESLGLKVELRWHQRIIYLFRARKL